MSDECPIHPRRTLRPRNEPSQARPESRDYEAGGREPDPTDFFIRLMKRAAEIGAARLEAAHEQSEAERAARREAAEMVPVERDEDVDAPGRKAAQDPADLAYERVTRAMRYCAALAVRFHKERLDQEMMKAAEVAVENKQRRSRRKDQLKRVVEDAIEHEAKERDTAFEGEEFDRSFDDFDLRKALYERLEDEDIERDLDRCPRGELIARICRDLGIKVDWSLWQDAFWALEEARSKPPGSPFAEPLAPEEPGPEAATPAEPAPAEPKLEAAEPPEPEADDQGLRHIDIFDRPLTPEEQRRVDEDRAGIKDKYPPGSWSSG